MEYQIEPELDRRTPRAVRPSVGVPALGCLTLFFVPFIAIGVGVAVTAVKGVAEALHPTPQPQQGGMGLMFACFMGLFAVLWNGALGYMLYSSVKKARKDYLLVRDGVPVPATILERKIVEQNDSKQSVFRYQFTPIGSSAQVESGEQTQSKSRDGGLAVGDTVTALYMPNHPDQNALYRFCAFQANANHKTEYALGKKQEPLPLPVEVTPSQLAAHTIEPELRQPTPRLMEQRKKGQFKGIGCYILFCTPFVVVGIGVLLYTLALTVLTVAGTNTEAVIQSKEKSSGEGGMTYSLRYTFQANGRVYQSGDSIDSSDYNRFKSGDRVTVQYLSFFPMGPTNLTDFSDNSLGFFWLFALFCNGILSVFTVLPYVFARREKALIRLGTAVPATITAKTMNTSGENDIYSLEYRFVPIGETQFQEGKKSVGEGEWKAVSIGDTFTLLYLSNAPKQQTLYRYSAYKARLP